MTMGVWSPVAALEQRRQERAERWAQPRAGQVGQPFQVRPPAQAEVPRALIPALQEQQQ